MLCQAHAVKRSRGVCVELCELLNRALDWGGGGAVRTSPCILIEVWCFVWNFTKIVRYTVGKEDVSTSWTYPRKTEPSLTTLNCDIRTDNDFQCHTFLEPRRFVSFAGKKGAFINHSSRNDPLGLGILPNEFLMLYYHDIDGRFIVANGNNVTSACLEYHKALETFSCRNSNTAYNGITLLQWYIP